jgi:hypothetical protein
MCRYFGGDSLAFLDVGAIYKSYLRHHLIKQDPGRIFACQNALKGTLGRFIKPLGFEA